MQMTMPLDEGCTVADSEREADTAEGNSQAFSARNVVDDSPSTYWYVVARYYQLCMLVQSSSTSLAGFFPAW